MDTNARIKTLFGLNSPQEDNVALELSSLCSLYSMTPENLKFKWEAFALNTNCPLKPTLPYIKFLKNSLQREFERSLKARKTTTGRVTTRRAPVMDLSEYGIDTGSQEDSVESFMNGVFGGAVKQNKIIPMSPSASVSDTQLSEISSLFITRKSAHVLDGQYNGHLAERGEYVEQSLTFKHLQKPIQPYRFMYEKTKVKTDALDERIDYIGSLIAEEHQIELYANPTRPTQESIYAYGSICSDAVEGKLNEKSVILQTSRDLGMGRRVRLNLSRLENYNLFPGQIIAVRGINHNGDHFFVEEIYMPPTPKKLPNTTMSTGGNPIEMITAAGPFTLDDDLSFQPLEDLLNMCSLQKPDIVLLMGPFISYEHPKIKKGAIQSLPEQIFREQVISRVEKLLEASQHTRVLILSHADDMIHTFPLFPQPMLSNMTNHPRIHMLSNPASFSVNDHTISVGNIDILFKLAKEEIARSTTHVDRFSKLSQQILQQHSYYPLFPRALGDAIDSEKMIDIQLSWKPDVLILPSQFKHFAKNIEGTVCINPGHLCKSLAAGTYSKIILYPTTNENEQVRVDLYKL